MPTHDAILVTPPLSRGVQAELFDFMPEGSIELRRVELAPGELGEPATAIAIISLSYVAITAICAWLASKGKGVSFEGELKVPGISGGIKLTLTDESKPETVRQELANRGIQIPDRPS